MDKFLNIKGYLFILSLIAFSCNSTSSDESKYADSLRVSDQTESNSENEDKYPDGEYCADISYYNPHTGRQSSYTLIVDVENMELTDIQWPNGGVLDRHHFENAEINNEGHTSFTNDKGYQYDVNIKGSAENCFVNLKPPVQCRGITRKGTRCKHLTANENGLCWQHQNQK
ncbi:MAG TPA: DUF5763 domain-containing protein [Aquella sp.]|nr:DUF5763 domain-containing protein [Aquella sp.]